MTVKIMAKIGIYDKKNAFPVLSYGKIEQRRVLGLPGRIEYLLKKEEY